MGAIEERGYASTEALVSTDWVAEHLNDPNLRIAESNEDPLLYPSGHIPGAVEVDWTRDLNNPLRRDYLDKNEFERLMKKIGVKPDTTVVLYGDKSNWWACYAFWVFQLFGHSKAKIMDGGRLKWENEGRTLARETPNYSPTQYEAKERDDSKIRVFRDQVLEHVKVKRVERFAQDLGVFGSGRRLQAQQFADQLLAFFLFGVVGTGELDGLFGRGGEGFAKSQVGSDAFGEFQPGGR